MSVVLVTSAVRPNAVDDTRLVDHDARLIQTREAIYKIVADEVFEKVVLVDGTNTPIFSDLEILELRSRTGIEIEQIVFGQQNEKVKIRGKSFGEMEILQYALENSKIIAEYGYFYKISGRYYINNMKEIIEAVECEDNIFFFDNPPVIPLIGKFVSTIFYKAQKEFFLDVFGDAQMECSYDPKGYLEAVFFRRLVKRSRTRCFVPFPWYDAVSGTSGLKAINRHYVKRNIASKLGMLCWSYS